MIKPEENHIEDGEPSFDPTDIGEMDVFDVEPAGIESLVERQENFEFQHAFTVLHPVGGE